MTVTCKLANCGRIFASDRSLFCHQKRDRIHNPDKSYANYAGNKRHSISYETSNEENRNQSHKKSHIAGPQYIDLDIMEDALIHTTDDEDYDNGDVDDEDDG